MRVYTLMFFPFFYISVNIFTDNTDNTKKMSFRPTIISDVLINGFIESSEFITIGSTRLSTTLSQTGTTVIGTLGDFVSGMQGGVIQYADKTTAFIVAFINPFSLTVSPSQNKPQQVASIIYGGLQLSSTGASVENINTTNFTAINLSGTNIVAFNDISAGNNITATGALIGGSANVIGNVNIGGNIVISGTVTVNNIAATGNISAGGTLQGTDVVATNNITATNTIQGTDLVATNNITATNTIQGTNLTATNNVTATNVNATNNVTATNTVSATNVTATNQVSANTINTTGQISGPSLLIGGGGIQSVGNISSTNGSISTINGNITTTNGNIQGNNVTATGTMSGGNLVATSSFTSPSVQLPTILTTKGELLGTNGVGGNLVAAPAGSNGSPLIYNSAQSTGIQHGLFNILHSLGNPTGWTGPAGVVIEITRIGTFAWIRFTGGTALNPFTNTSGIGQAFGGSFALSAQYVPTSQTRNVIWMEVNGTPGLVILQLESGGASQINYTVYPTNVTGLGFTWGAGTTLAFDGSVSMTYLCQGL